MAGRDGILKRLHSEILDRVSDIQRNLPEMGQTTRPAPTNLQALKRELRRERARGRCGHWTYNLARHMALLQDVRRAEEALRGAPPLAAAPESGTPLREPASNANGPRGGRHAGRLTLAFQVR